MPTAVSASPRAPASSFAIRGLAWGLAAFGLLRLPWVEAHGVLPLTRFQGQLAALFTGAPLLTVDVTLACSGAELMAICAGAMLAYPSRWRTRIAGLLCGLTLILVLNTIRIATLALVTGTPATFDALHLYVWPAVLALAVAGYVFMWMRRTDAPAAVPSPVSAHARAPARLRSRRFAILTAALIILFAAASPLYLNSAWVLAVAGFIARAAAVILAATGIAAVATGNMLVTARGGFLVTQECISTPLIPVYVAAVFAYADGWRRRVPALIAILPLFVALGIVRLLIVALPGALIGSPMFLIHAFYQLLTAALVVCAAAYWRHDALMAWRRAAGGLVLGGVLLYALALVAARVVAPAPGIPDAQGALTLLPAFQIAFFASLWIAVSAPAGWRPFAAGLILLVLSQAVLFGAMYASEAVAMLATRVRDVRAWSLAAPILLIAALKVYDPPRRHSAKKIET